MLLWGQVGCPLERGQDGLHARPALLRDCLWLSKEKILRVFAFSFEKALSQLMFCV